MKLLTILLITSLSLNFTGSSVILTEEPVLVYPDQMEESILRFDPFERIIGVDDVEDAVEVMDIPTEEPLKIPYKPMEEEAPEVTETVEDITEEPEPEPEVIEPVYISLGKAKITAYCSCKKCCGKWALNRPKDENGNDIVYGASGNVLIPGYSVAVDPDVIPYGTKIYINGQEYIAHDCGGKIDGNDIDVYFADHQEAWDFAAQFWKKPTEIFILEE